jgi:TPP-dependent pyruvate/acetoin dehydrogenase alpha subunit
MDIPYLDLYEKTILIRNFENRLLELFSKGELFGTTHTYIGQEAIAVSAISHLTENDIVFSNHRCHGHYLAKEDDPKGLLAEIMGRDIGTCAGRGGSQHLCRSNFFSNGIQGGYLPNALGMAFAEKYTQRNNIVVAFIGDGTLGEGLVYETMNMAALWKVPLLIIVENNQYAQTTPINSNLSGSIIERAKAFNISASEVESNDIKVLYPIFGKLIDKVRKNGGPYLQVVNTYRLSAHSKGDDFRSVKEIDFWRKRDPLIYFENVLTKNERKIISQKVAQRLLTIEEEVFNSPFASFN